MTKIHILSDIHDDYSRGSLGNFRIPETDAQVIVIAGDIAGRLSQMGRSWLEAQTRGVPIVVVPGNHDFWRGDLTGEVARYRRKQMVDFVHILDGEPIEIAGCRFVGATLWTDYALANPEDTYPAQREALTNLTDFRYIRRNKGADRVYPVDFANEHDRHRTAIAKILSKPFRGPTVVVTHHAPSRQSLRNPDKVELLDAAYASDLEELIVNRQPDLWIHGHVHTPRDYMIGETRVICNPRGYRHAAHTMSTRHRAPDAVEVAEFNDSLVIEVKRKPRLDASGMPMSYEDEVERNSEMAAIRDLLDAEWNSDEPQEWKP